MTKHPLEELNEKFMALAAVPGDKITQEMLSEVDKTLDELKQNAANHKAAHDLLMNRYEAYLPIRNNISAKLKAKSK